MPSSELTNTIEQFNVYVHRNETHFTYIYVYHTNVFDAENIFKNPPKLSFHLSVLLFFISLLGSTHDSPDHQLPAGQVRMMHGWVASAVWPPKQKSWLRRCYRRGGIHVYDLEPEPPLADTSSFARYAFPLN